MTSLYAFGQQKEVTVPFSNANGDKMLDVEVFSADIKIIGSSRTDVLIKYSVEKQEDHDDSEQDDKSKGMKKIGGSNFQFEIGEKNNKVRIFTQNFMNNVLIMEIEVPSGIDINISKQIGQNIYIENIQGAVNVENNIGSVTMKGISGSVNASSSTGDIIVGFETVNAEDAMSFNTITGNIDLTLPKNFKSDLKMRTEWGDIYSDLPIETVTKEASETKSTSKNGEMRVISNSWTYGTLNGGGSEMTLKTQMGSIYLRAKE
ncbi:hypothetical protein GCM10007940_16860 [Portibacter lacus]|uniref:DUF4097 domain-containing protein n=2 Tax=Portibacter lacus TaxID=1099794 RepID=A0AA37SME6_9BACT|nr:hypothetical protein GCM10007940_16860 [Portibacter lacus]